VVLSEENHMQLTEAETLDRKSGEVEGSAVPPIHKPIPSGSATLPFVIPTEA
jgi:hypothetical protein